MVETDKNNRIGVRLGWRYAALRKTALGGGVLAALAVAPFAAEAQGQSQGQPQNQPQPPSQTRSQNQEGRTQPAVEPPILPGGALKKRGLPVGDFVFNAGIEVAEQYDDNIFATPRNKVDDWITTVSPFVALSSNWKEHEVKLDAGATIGRYADRTSEDYEDFSAGIEGRYDLAGGSNIFGGARFNREHESRESPDDVSGSKPTTYDRIETYAGTLQRFGAASLRFGGTWDHYDFDDVPSALGGINNDDRDRDQFELGARLGYRLDRVMEPFVQAAVNWRRYNAGRDDAGFDRDSRGIGAAVGTRLFIAPGIEGEVLVGYMGQDYQDRAFGNRSALDFGGYLNWTVAANTRINFYVDRTLEETTIPGSSGYINTTGGVGIDHAIRRDLVLTGSASYTYSDFAGTGRIDELMGVGAGLKYFLTPNIYAGTDYRFIRRHSNVTAAEFDENLITVRLGAQLADGLRDTGSVPPQESGFYGGLQAGYGQLGTELSGPRGAGTLEAEFADSSFVGGAFIGYGVTSGRWNVGLELEAEDGDAKWDHARLPGGRVYSVERGPSVGGALRLGHWLPYGSLIYGRFGVVRTEFDTDYRTASGMAFDRKDTRYGVRYGGGVEAPLAQRFFLRLDYTFTSYQDYDVTAPSGTDNFDNTESVLRVGVGYRFHDLPKENGGERPAARFDGFYAGAQGGYGTVDTDNTGPRDAGSTLSADRGGNGVAGGIFAGYGVRLGDVYLGVEVDAAMSDAEWQITRDPTGRVYSVEQKESYGAGARVGYIVGDSVLIYGRVGAQRTRFNTRYAEGANFVDQDNTQTGLRLGGGVEVPATENVFVRFDYSVVTALNGYQVNYNSGVDSFDNKLGQFQLGVGYRF